MEKKLELVVLADYEAAAVGQDLLAVEKVQRRRFDLGRVASEADARVAFLRSRPLTESRELRDRERAVIEELGQFAERARAFLAAERDGTLSEAEAAEEREKLDKLAFASIGRFSALLEALDERFPARAKPETPAKRAEELAAIERFLAAKRAAASGPEEAGFAGRRAEAAGRSIRSEGK